MRPERQPLPRHPQRPWRSVETATRLAPGSRAAINRRTRLLKPAESPEDKEEP